ncbi:DUF2953 domain-containing protein [Fictibacillus sp. 5RED26]|uniref:DUF2953 domain-containing protein n=1 Tax=unclassified Fictibacillus TaxID=2644029 RepID=UPI0018CF2D50|nr:MULTISPECIES: DUF2953 domain-containing protein [unclassified Fictibacillus]MBH0157842.1 DUF2953 domain-containing protein [Fictibacillus sp. 5RED26]MBH0163444.1 DUF2953 domain-containing protein [Fictibacillus sp. 7GRE50]MBH0175239.1 DUF2953 domain-containing protein [Fictibacillus sp. 23RED33]
MVWFTIIIGILLFLLIVISLSTIHISIYFVHRNDNSNIQINFKMYHFLKYKLNVPLIMVDAQDHSVKIREEKETTLGQKKEKKKITFLQLKNQYQSFKKMLKHINHFYQILAAFLKKMRMKKVEWHSAIGLGEASSSAIAAGAVWGFKGIAIQVLNTFFKLEESPNVSVVPVFQGMHSETRFSCMISFKIGHAIVVMLKILKSWRIVSRSAKVNSEYMTGGM